MRNLRSGHQHAASAGNSNFGNLKQRRTRPRVRGLRTAYIDQQAFQTLLVVVNMMTLSLYNGKPIGPISRTSAKLTAKQIDTTAGGSLH